jgi:chromosome segregation ATPase
MPLVLTYYHRPELGAALAAEFGAVRSHKAVQAEKHNISAKVQKLRAEEAKLRAARQAATLDAAKKQAHVDQAGHPKHGKSPEDELGAALEKEDNAVHAHEDVRCALRMARTEEHKIRTEEQRLRADRQDAELAVARAQARADGMYGTAFAREKDKVSASRAS